MAENEGLGDGTVSWIASTVADGTATPNDARRLLVEFVHQVETGKLRPRLLEHMRDCVHAFLTGEKTLWRTDSNPSRSVPIPTMEKAFGLTRLTAGRAPIDNDTLCEVALQVLLKRSSGATLEQATFDVAAERKAAGLPVSSDTQVRDAWSATKEDRAIWVRISDWLERQEDAALPPLSPNQDPGAVPPENGKNKAA